MKIKNISNKPITVGVNVILPGDTATVTGYDENPAVKALVKAKLISTAKEAAPAAAPAKTEAPKPEPPKPEQPKGKAQKPEASTEGK